MNTDITTTFKNYVNNGGTLHYRATLTLNNSSKTTLQLGDNDFLQDTWEFQYDSCEGDFDIGGAISSQFKCTLNNLTGKFTNYINYLDGGIIKVYLQSVKETETYNSKTCLVTKTFTKDEEFCWGEFVVKVNFQHYETIDLQCYDRLYLLQQVNIIDYLNSIKSNRKLKSSIYKASTPFLISCMIDWFSDFGITASAGINNFCYALQGTFLLPKEFWAAGFTTPTFYPRKQVSSDVKNYTSDYDCQWLPADNELWKDKTLLDFLRYFCQMFGCYAQIRPNNTNANKLYIDRYSKKIDYTVNYKSINSLTHSYKTYTKELQQVVVKTCDTKVPMCGLPAVLYASLPGNPKLTLKQQKYFTDRILVAPVSTGGYEIGHKEAYITIEDNPFILLPTGDKPFDSYAYANNWTIMDHDGSNGYFYVTARDVFGWSTDTRTCSDLRFASAVQIAQNLHDTKENKFGSLEGLRVCEFQCSCKPLVGLRVGQRIKIFRDEKGNYIDSLLNHIVFKPNVSITLSTTFDGENAKTSHPNAISIFTKNDNNAVFKAFFADIQKSTKDCYTSILNNMRPDRLFPCIKVLYDKNKGGEYAASMTNNEIKWFYHLMLYYLGERSNSYTWSYDITASGLIENPRYRGTAMDVKPVWTSK